MPIQPLRAPEGCCRPRHGPHRPNLSLAPLQGLLWPACFARWRARKKIRRKISWVPSRLPDLQPTGGRRGVAARGTSHLLPYRLYGLRVPRSLKHAARRGRRRGSSRRGGSGGRVKRRGRNGKKKQGSNKAQARVHKVPLAARRRQTAAEPQRAEHWPALVQTQTSTEDGVMA